MYSFPMSPISSMRSRVILKLNHEHLEMLRKPDGPEATDESSPPDFRNRISVLL